MIYSHEVQHMCVVKKGANHQCAPIPDKESGLEQLRSLISLV